MRLTFLISLPLALLLLLQLVAASEQDQQLFGWHDFNLNIDDKATADAVTQFAEQNKMLIATYNHLDFPEDVVVAPHLSEKFTQLLQKRNVQFEIPVADVGKMLQQERDENIAVQKMSSRNDPSTFFAQSSQIYSWLRALVSQNKGFATLENIGKSYENRDLLILKLSTNPSAKKPIIFLDSAIHAREWLAPATLNYIINAFINDRGSSDTKALLEKYDWYFMPVVNPDGYDYTFRSSSTRYWRKTRKPYATFFNGADPNRNFDYQFGGAGTSNNPASDIYHGPRAFSEPETLALSQYLQTIKSRLVKGMYLSFHTYGQYWLTPPGYTRQNPSDHAEMMRIGNVGRNAILNAGGVPFKVGQPANTGLYEAAGGSYDWVKYVLGVKYSFTLELRPSPGKGLGGFAARVSDIQPSGREVYAAVKAVVNALP